MGRRLFTHAVSLAVGLFALVGCQGSSGVQTLMPRHKLLPQARDFRSVSPAPSGPRELATVPHPAHVVEAGDVLNVYAEELDAPVRIPADQPVLADGTIDLGKYGRPVVSGKTVDIIETELNGLVKEKLKPGELVTIHVRIVNRNSKVFYVLGEVNAPGAYPVTGRETALDAIITAGGLTERASERSIVLSRPSMPCDCRIVKPVCYPHIVQLGDTTTNYQIMAGDRIYVPSRTLKEMICPKGCSKICGPCDTPQVLCPMDRPHCGTDVECEGPNCRPIRKVIGSRSKKAESCEADCQGDCGGRWGVNGCLIGKSSKLGAEKAGEIVPEPKPIPESKAFFEAKPTDLKPTSPQPDVKPTSEMKTEVKPLIEEKTTVEVKTESKPVESKPVESKPSSDMPSLELKPIEAMPPTGLPSLELKSDLKPIEAKSPSDMPSLDLSSIPLPEIPKPIAPKKP